MTLTTQSSSDIQNILGQFVSKSKLTVSKMSNGFIGDVLYLLLILVEFILKIVYSACYCFTYILRCILSQLIDVKMIETSKKRKRNSNEKSNLTVAVRGVIDANWQKLLSNTLLMDKKTEKPQDDKNDHYTGTFRRTRKKKEKDDLLNAVQNVRIVNLAQNENSDSTGRTGHEQRKNKLTKFLAMDCEMVGIGYNGDDHMLARVSIVNKFGDCVYDKFVKAREEVKDYRTSVSGVRKEDLLNGEEFSTVQKEVSELIKGRILVGHSLKNDLSVLFLSHAKRNIRDTSRYKPFRKITKGSTPSLKRLAKEILGIDIQHGEHSSVEDARAAMQLYCTVAKTWESDMSTKRGHKKIDE